MVKSEQKWIKILNYKVFFVCFFLYSDCVPASQEIKRDMNCVSNPDCSKFVIQVLIPDLKNKQTKQKQQNNQKSDKNLIDLLKF